MRLADAFCVRTLRLLRCRRQRQERELHARRHHLHFLLLLRLRLQCLTRRQYMRARLHERRLLLRRRRRLRRPLRLRRLLLRRRRRRLVFFPRRRFPKRRRIVFFMRLADAACLRIVFLLRLPLRLHRKRRQRQERDLHARRNHLHCRVGFEALFLLILQYLLYLPLPLLLQYLLLSILQ